MARRITMYTGSYAEADETGICCYSGSEETAELILSGTGAGIENPSYIAVSSDNTYVYAVSETMNFGEEPGGSVAAFQIRDNLMVPLNQVGTGGTLPCHILLDEKRQFLYVSNYMSGSVSMFPLNPDHSIGTRCDFCQQEGHGPNPERQEGPHVHFSGFSRDMEGIWCVDLGTDRLKYYRIDEANARLVSCPERDIILPEGVGPRHFVLAPGGKEWMYLVCELSSEVIVIDCSAAKPEILQRISTLSQSMKESTCAAIKLSEDGRFLYASNRGDDSIAVFAIQEETGRLSLVEIVKTQGKNPRDFAVCGEWLFAANQDSNTVAAFRVNGENGTLTFVNTLEVSAKPVCVVTI